MHADGVPRFVRILLMGGQDITDSVAEKLGVPLQEAEGIKQTLGLVGAGGEYDRASRVVDSVAQTLPGRGARVPGLLRRVQHRASRSTASSSPVAGSCLRGLTERLATHDAASTSSTADPISSLKIGKTGLSEQQLSFVKPLAAVPVGLALGAV